MSMTEAERQRLLRQRRKARLARADRMEAGLWAILEKLADNDKPLAAEIKVMAAQSLMKGEGDE